ncbi:hypothetical protein YC2023_038427 [Brassica napus]
MSMPPSVSEKVLWDMIEGFTEEIKLAGGIGCFEKRMHHQGVPVNNNQCESGPNVEYAVTAPPLQAPTVENASSMEDRARTEENEMQSRRARSDHSIFWR